MLILNLTTGKKTDVLKRSVASEQPDNICFSVVLADRTLDLACKDTTQRNLWVKVKYLGLKYIKKWV